MKTYTVSMVCKRGTIVHSYIKAESKEEAREKIAGEIARTPPASNGNEIVSFEIGREVNES